MDFNSSNLSPYAKMIQRGLALANRKMLEWDAALGHTLVFGRMDGSYERIEATVFLEEIRKSSWWANNFDDTTKTDSQSQA